MAKGAYDHRQVIDHISFDAGGVLVYLDDVRMAKLLSEFCGREVTPAQCMRAERCIVPSPCSGDLHGYDKAPQWAYEYFGALTRITLGHDPELHPGFEGFVERCYDINVNGTLFSKIGHDVVETLSRLQRHGFRLSVTSDASGQVARNFRTQGLDGFFDFILDSGQEGVRKPELYANLIRRAEVPPTRILHVDNNEMLVHRALECGMQAVFFDPQGLCVSPSPKLKRFRNLLDLADMLTGHDS